MSFGAMNYMIAFLGKPSKTTPWILQLGGHHLAINIYYKGTTGAATPYHVAAQPTVWKDDQGKTHEPLAPMRESLHGLLTSLTPEQSKQAKLEARFNDVYVGPGKDGKFPAKSEGVPVSELSDASKDFVKKAIAAWTGDSPQGAEYRKLYEAELDKVKVSYSGATDLSDRGDYVRIDGPRVWIEFATPGERPCPHDLAGPADRLRRRILLLRYRCDGSSLPSCFVMAARPAWGHPMPNSAVVLRLHRAEIDAELTLPIGELATGWEKPLPMDAVQTVRQYGEELKDYVRVARPPVRSRTGGPGR